MRSDERIPTLVSSTTLKSWDIVRSVMQENLFHLHVAESQSVPYPQTLPVLSPHANGPTQLNGEEEPYTIKCICGFPDDDGNTVLCEQCNTWQHIECYYHPNLAVPDVHQCADCFPRPVDSAGAAQRQRRLREPLNAGEERKPRRPGPKSHRKSKTKELNHLGHTNGWASHDNSVSDGKSGSPRDQQPPPAKRPKTNHKSSGSFNSTFGAATGLLGQRNRTGSNALAAHNPTKPPLGERPPNYFSEDFIRIHQENTDFVLASANLFLNIGVTNLLSVWLDDVEAFAGVTNGLTHADVFMQLQQPIEELESPIEKQIFRDETATFHGSHPVWPYIVVDKDLSVGNIVGELRGSIGHLHDYKLDPSNRWDILHHPDHFVFFHPHLPIYIDCRSEGTLLRYTRRTCRPNTQLTTFITGAREYRFCFTAIEDIPRGSEITIAWDIAHDQQLHDGLLSSSQGSSKEYMHEWVENILAQFGGCACERLQDAFCLLGHFDRRLNDVATESRPRHPKGHKRKKASVPKDTPPSTGRATNSRAGSEGSRHEHTVDNVEGHVSSTRSSRSRTSRDASPSANSVQHNVNGTHNELSARDRRKLEQQERLFEQLEQGQRRKKRHSGSNVNTPTVPIPKSLGWSNSPTSNPNTPAPGERKQTTDDDNPYSGPAALETHRGTSNSPRPDTPLQQLQGRDAIQRRPTLPVTPTYADASTQTAMNNPPHASPIKRKPYISLSQRLLTRSHLRSVRSEAQAMEVPVEDSNSALYVPSDTSPPAMLPGNPAPSSADQETALHDVEIKDFEPLLPHVPPPLTMEPEPGSPSITQMPLQPSHPPIKPPAPPWPSTEPQTHVEEQQHLPGHRSAGLHVDLPPARLFDSDSIAGISISATPGPLSASAFQSPLSLSSSPSLPARSFMLPVSLGTKSISQPSPIRKKMSLTDYMKKKKTPALEKTQSESLHSMGATAGIRQSPGFSANPGSEGSENASDSADRNGVEQDALGDAMKLD